MDCEPIISRSQYPFRQATKYSSMECTGNVLVFFSRAFILQTLDQIQTELSFDLKHRSEAAGLLSSIQTREFMATALFKEVFAKTGPLSRYLQSVNMDYMRKHLH